MGIDFFTALGAAGKGLLDGMAKNKEADEADELLQYNVNRLNAQDARTAEEFNRKLAQYDYTTQDNELRRNASVTGTKAFEEYKKSNRQVTPVGLDPYSQLIFDQLREKDQDELDFLAANDNISQLLALANPTPALFQETALTLLPKMSTGAKKYFLNLLPLYLEWVNSAANTSQSGPSSVPGGGITSGQQKTVNPAAPTSLGNTMQQTPPATGTGMPQSSTGWLSGGRPFSPLSQVPMSEADTSTELLSMPAGGDNAGRSTDPLSGLASLSDSSAGTRATFPLNLSDPVWGATDAQPTGTRRALANGAATANATTAHAQARRGVQQADTSHTTLAAANQLLRTSQALMKQYRTLAKGAVKGKFNWNKPDPLNPGQTLGSSYAHAKAEYRTAWQLVKGKRKR